MNIPIEFLIAGGLGGLARGCFGIWKFAKKQKAENPDKKLLEVIDWTYLIITIISTTVVGAVVGVVVDRTFWLALTAGYTGIDVIENIFKLKKITPPIISE